MYELVLMRAVIQVVDGKAVSREITKTPICELDAAELVRALKYGPAHYKPDIQEDAVVGTCAAAGC